MIAIGMGIALLIEMLLMALFGWSGMDSLFTISLAALGITSAALMGACILKLVS